MKNNTIYSYNSYLRSISGIAVVKTTLLSIGLKLERANYLAFNTQGERAFYEIINLFF